jgi:hypothetical protein
MCHTPARQRGGGAHLSAGGSLFDPETQTQLNLSLRQVTPWKPFVVGPYTVIAFPPITIP